MSAATASGTSSAAKCPPRCISVKRRMLKNHSASSRVGRMMSPVPSHRGRPHSATGYREACGASRRAWLARPRSGTGGCRRRYSCTLRLSGLIRIFVDASHQSRGSGGGTARSSSEGSMRKGSDWACTLISRRDDLLRETLPWCKEENTSTKFSQSPLRQSSEAAPVLALVLLADHDAEPCEFGAQLRRIAFAVVALAQRPGAGLK